LRRNTNTRLTFGGDIKSTPLWTPDSRFIVFQAAGGMYWVRADGTVGKPQILVSSNGVQYPWSFAPDGSRLAFFERRPTDLKEPDIWTIPIQIDAAGLHAGKPEPFLQTPFNEMAPAFSPDGRWIAYSSNESGIAEVYVRAFPDQRGKSQISEGGGTYPRWSRSGNELYFFSADGHIMVASYSARGASLMAEKPRQWSARRFMTNPIFGDIYDVAPDGKGVIALVAADLDDQPSPNHVMFLMNFFDELRRRMQPR
jgi:Tol biopolymer transport system component